MAPDFFDINVLSQKCIGTTFQKMGDCDIADTLTLLTNVKGRA